MVKIAAQIPLTYTHCAYCELPFTQSQHSLENGRRRTRDHFIPKSKGGKHSDDNIFIICQYCNTLKGNFLPHEFIYWLRCKIKWKEYPVINRITYNAKILEVVKKNVRLFYDKKGLIPANIIIPKKHVASKKTEEKTKTELIAIEGIHYLNYLENACPCIGFVDTSIGNGVNKYQNVYYHSGHDKYLFVHCITKEIIVYDKSVIEKNIKPFFKDQSPLRKTIPVNDKITKQYPTSVQDDVVARLLAAPEPNFHY